MRAAKGESFRTAFSELIEDLDLRCCFNQFRPDPKKRPRESQGNPPKSWNTTSNNPEIPSQDRYRRGNNLGDYRLLEEESVSDSDPQRTGRPETVSEVDYGPVTSRTSYYSEPKYERPVYTEVDTPPPGYWRSNVERDYPNPKIRHEIVHYQNESFSPEIADKGTQTWETDQPSPLPNQVIEEPPDFKAKYRKPKGFEEIIELPPRHVRVFRSVPVGPSERVTTGLTARGPYHREFSPSEYVDTQGYYPSSIDYDMSSSDRRTDNRFSNHTGQYDQTQYAETSFTEDYNQMRNNNRGGYSQDAYSHGQNQNKQAFWLPSDDRRRGRVTGWCVAVGFIIALCSVGIPLLLIGAILIFVGDSDSNT